MRTHEPVPVRPERWRLGVSWEGRREQGGGNGEFVSDEREADGGVGRWGGKRGEKEAFTGVGGGQVLGIDEEEEQGCCLELGGSGVSWWWFFDGSGWRRFTGLCSEDLAC